MAMSSQEKFGYWLEVAQHDLLTAGTMLAAKNWVYLGFMCQQALEKLVKGLYVLYIDDNVPRTHSIGKLMENIKDKLPAKIPSETTKLFDALSVCYLNNRYPEYKRALAAQIDEERAKGLHAQTQEVFAWLLTLKP
jgi:HEPN domain-containing protein